MTDLETPEQFVWTLTAGAEDVGQVDVAHLLTEDDVASWLSAAIRARDAAVRREALREAADWLAAKVAEVRVVTRDCRREAVALKAAGKDWNDAFDRECLSSSRCGGFEDAETYVRALATGGSDD